MRLPTFKADHTELPGAHSNAESTGAPAWNPPAPLPGHTQSPQLGTLGPDQTSRRISEIEERFRRTSALCLAFFVNEGGTRVHVTLSRPTLMSTHIGRLIERDAQFKALTTREHEIATAVALGFSNDDISFYQGLSKRTVDKHVSNILTRLGFQNRAQIATLVAATGAWLVPFSPGSELEDQIEVLGVLGDTQLRVGVTPSTVDVELPTLHVGSLLPANPEKQMEALAMSKGEDLAVAGTSADRIVCSRFPVRITRTFSSDAGVERAVSDLLAGGVQALTIGNFDIATAERILKHPELRGIPVLHSMVNRQAHSSTDPDYSHVFQMCADEFVYLRALAAYVRAFQPQTSRISVIIRESDNVEVSEAVRVALGAGPQIEVKVIRFDDRHTNVAEIVLELLQFAPDIAYLGIYIESALVDMLAQIRGLGLKTQLFGVWVPGLPGFTQRHPELAEGLVWSTLVGNSNNHFGNQFRSSFEARYRSSPGIGSAAVHYDMIALLRRAWQDTGLEPSSGMIIEALNSVRFTGVTGSFHFDGGRQRKALCFPFDTDDPAIGQPCLTFEIQHGKSVPISLLGAAPAED